MKAEDPPIAAVQTSSGSSPHYSAPPNSELLWEVHWKASKVSLASKSEVIGQMQGVTGKIYEKGKVTCTFSSDSGQGNNKTEELSLFKNVTIISMEPGVTLYCDELIYSGKGRQFHAIGNVKLESKLGTIGPLRELWANGELTHVTTNVELMR